ncbi:hypothetical protein [Acetobacter persici]|uniref:hypothetical protein n=1 Tax=Acetobacter persici TaxID=1076596 RepID=UPI001BACB4F6|nr:hypothetical protein [Acetobacter persici]MBS1015173.1 hypothetical protein [Acetobacter persici]
MTPLAQAILKDMNRTKNCKKMPGGIMVIKKLEECTFFDATNVLDAAMDLQGKMIEVDSGDDLIFLPSNPVFIEFYEPEHRSVRYGFMLEEQKGDIIQTEFQLNRRGKYQWFNRRTSHLDLFRKHDPDRHPNARERTNQLRKLFFDWPIAAILAMINSPRIISRKTHLPQSYEQKHLANKKTPVGKYPLQAWTELLLEVTPPKDESGLPERETVLTGERALHFVRAHLRIVGGKLVRVSAHWRGNAALGIKRTRYTVIPPKNGVWPKFMGAAP